MKDKSPILIALLGVVIGVLGTIIVGIAGRQQKKAASDKDWSKLNLVLQQVRENYVDEVNVPEVTEAAIIAALSKLDPHSLYLPPTDLQEAETDLAGNFDGIGIQFNVPNDTAIVLEVIAGGPSEKAGLLPGDRILEVDGKVIAGVKYPQDSMVRRMKGPAGTNVKIKIIRDKEPVVFDITRGRIPIHCVDASFMIGDTTGYIRLNKFSATTYQEVFIAATDLYRQGMKKLVMDIRDNSGGYFSQALLLSNLFLGQGDNIVYLDGLHRKREEYKADGKGAFQDLKLVVIINENSASSSEIFAGAIQDNDRGVIVGRRSYGKGLVQEPLYFTDGSAVRISVARYYTPSGRCIQRPYNGGGQEYQMDIYNRYLDGEMFSQDSVKTDTTDVYYTVSGRTVYGGGGIMPDIYVPIDTTRATDFYVKCNRKALPVKFSSEIFDKYKARLGAIDNFGDLENFFENINIPAAFLSYAAKEGVYAKRGEWDASKSYMMPYLRALIGRYSKLGQNAYYKLFLPVDDTVTVALTAE
ncbi:MAG: S41 family peptidase [Bacteroidales bacterium]|nr:S41 family peptidase [Bacteroidales bacterium]